MNMREIGENQLNTRDVYWGTIEDIRGKTNNTVDSYTDEITVIVLVTQNSYSKGRNIKCDCEGIGKGLRRELHLLGDINEDKSFDETRGKRKIVMTGRSITILKESAVPFRTLKKMM